MWQNKASYNGLSVLPYDTGNYQQAPFEDISREKFEALEKSLRAIDLRNVYEADDETEHTAEAACAGGACQIT
jgi:ribonucleoside-diphosphate reductase alpha chain